MEWKIVHLDETDSTNRWLRRFLSKENRRKGEALQDSDKKTPKLLNSLENNQSLAVMAEYQTAGKGCGSNSWESERGKNLTFSLLIHPKDIPARRQFQISMAVSLAVCEALERVFKPLSPTDSSPDSGEQEVSIKWPNDIYVGDRKICGMLIENQLKGEEIKDSIIGIGLNVNQREFRSDAPNPVSLWQIIHQETDREQLLDDVLSCLEHYLYQDIRQQYLQKLYRRKGFHPYRDKDETFMAEIVDVEDSGHLVLLDDSGRQRRYAFKEVQFCLKETNCHNLP